jgi:hypothetical protein
MLVQNPLLTVAQVAEHIGWSTKHVRALIARGDLNASVLPGRAGTRGLIRVRLVDLDALLDKPAQYRDG